MERKRVVSLIASATEIVCALGRFGWLVGRSHECDHPPEVRVLPTCSLPRLKTDVPSREIDRSVKRLLEQGLSVYEVDAVRLRALRPDVIVTQDQCEVCAVSLKDLKRAACDWMDGSVEIVSLRTDCLHDLWRDIGHVADVLDCPDEGRRLAVRLQEEMAAVAAKSRAIGPTPRVASLEWIEPLMASGNWMPELIERAGGANLFGKTGRHSPWITWEEVCSADPDVLLVSPCGFKVAQTEAEMHQLTAREGWRDVKAVREGRVYLADGNAYFHRPGPRLLDSLEILAEILHPETYSKRYPDTAWKRYTENP